MLGWLFFQGSRFQGKYWCYFTEGSKAYWRPLLKWPHKLFDWLEEILTNCFINIFYFIKKKLCDICFLSPHYICSFIKTVIYFLSMYFHVTFNSPNARNVVLINAAVLILSIVQYIHSCIFLLLLYMLPSHKNKPWFNRDKLIKLISNLVRFNRV